MRCCNYTSSTPGSVHFCFGNWSRKSHSEGHMPNSTMYNAPHWYLDRTMYEPRFDYDRRRGMQAGSPTQ